MSAVDAEDPLRSSLDALARLSSRRLALEELLTGVATLAVRAMARSLGLANVEAWHGRAEAFRQPHTHSVSRATAPLATLWAWHAPAAIEGAPGDGEWPAGLVVLKGGDLTDERAALQKQLAQDAGSRADVGHRCAGGEAAFRLQKIQHFRRVGGPVADVVLDSFGESLRGVQPYPPGSPLSNNGPPRGSARPPTSICFAWARE